MGAQNMRIGEMLLAEHLITPDQLDEALRRKKQDPTRKLGDILVESGAVSEADLAHTLSARLKIPYVDLVESGIEADAPALVPEELARKYMAIPIRKEGRVLTVASSDPMNFYAIDDLRLATNMEIRPVLATETDIRRAIGRCYSRQLVEEAAKDVNRAFSAAGHPEPETDLTDKAPGDAPVVRLVDSILQQGISLGASDIHIEPMGNETRVRVRVDGLMKTQMTLARAAHSSIVTRLKIMGNMNIAEHRLPQDGRVEISVQGRTVDMRLSVLPTVTGEKVVIRLLGGEGSVRSIDELGLSASNRSLFDRLIRTPNGILLVSGPTGSGKSTTLYSILRILNRPGVNIVTIEDPVEYRMAGINQVQVNPKAGLTFSSGLRSILRQDPDIIMIGEIRDSESAQIAIRAAITGHLVLSTIHTNDAASTVTRLVNMGVEPFLVSAGVVGVIAQRLVRRVCPRCGREYAPDDRERRILGIGPEIRLRRGGGCNNCDQTGYRGRVAVHEIMLLSRDIRTLIDRGATADELRAQAISDGTSTLQQNCRRLVLDGVTSFDEFMRATYSIG